MKLAQRELYREAAGEYPVLLFDDVLSELDSVRQEYILKGIGRGQVFITTCDSSACRVLESMIKSGEQKIKVFHVKQGKIEN